MVEQSNEIKKRTSFQVILLLAIIILLQTASGLYAVYDMSPPAAFSVIGYLGIFWLIGDWFTKDCKIRKIEWAFDMGSLLYLSWPIFIPYYLIKTKGLISALEICFGFIALYLGIYFLSYYVFYNVVS
jgi:hypothetical protein